MELSLVSYSLNNSIATIVMDDGKSNVISPQMINEINIALDKAVRDKAVVILKGREGIFSAGFDLKVMKKGNLDTIRMLRGGFKLALRILSFPTPVIVSCTGHAFAMGAFLLLSADYRIGILGDFKIVTNEVAIGLTMPNAGVEICRQRIIASEFTKASVLAETYNPQSAVSVGFLDDVKESDEVDKYSYEKALEYQTLDMRSHYRTKLRVRRDSIRLIRKYIQTDTIDFLLEGIRLSMNKKQKNS